MSEDLHREGIGGPRIIGHGADTVVDVGLKDDVLGLCLGIGESNRLLACLLDLLPLFRCESGQKGALSCGHSNRAEFGCLGLFCRSRIRLEYDSRASVAPAAEGQSSADPIAEQTVNNMNHSGGRVRLQRPIGPIRSQ